MILKVDVKYLLKRFDTESRGQISTEGEKGLTDWTMGLPSLSTVGDRGWTRSNTKDGVRDPAPLLGFNTH